MTADDLDAPEDFEQDIVAEKPSLREVWDTNPLLKMAAVVLGGAVLIGGYMIMFSGEETAETRAQVHKTAKETKIIPGQNPSDPAYTKALEEANKKNADIAAQTNESSLPVPIAPPKGGGLDIPEMPEKPNTDALKEWRKQTEGGNGRGGKSAMDIIEDEISAPPAEVVPMAPAVRPEQVVKQDPNAMKRLAEQMRVIVSAQAPATAKDLEITVEDSPYVLMRKEEEAAKMRAQTQADLAAASGATDGASADAAGTGDDDMARTIVPAGSIAYAQLLNELNSDIEGPVLAQVLSGPFAGGRALGQVTVKDEYMVITFSRVVKDAVSYTINGIALDEKTTLAGQATDVDHHYFTRIILPAAAKFIEGYGKSVAQTGTTVEQTDGGSQAAETPAPGAKESAYAGAAEAATKVSEMLDKDAERPVTVKVAKGTTMGVFFLDTVTNKDVEE